MANHVLTSITAQFTLGGNMRSSLDVTQNDWGCYDVRGTFSRKGGHEYPSEETLHRKGAVYPVTAEELAHSLRRIGDSHWYHHYRATHHRVHSEETRCWEIRIEYADGVVYCWEGVDDAPVEIDYAYETLVTFGMPQLYLGHRLSYALACGVRTSQDAEAGHLLCYEELFQDLHDMESSDRSIKEEVLVAEFADDVMLLQELCDCGRAEKVLELWGVGYDLESLSKVRVSDATRRQMYALFGGLVERDGYVTAVLQMLDEGVLACWWARLRELPAEEQEERRRLQEAKTLARNASIDSTVERWLAAGTLFTSYEVAEECGVSAREASMRIRSFVRSGKAQAVGDDVPRHYRAA